MHWETLPGPYKVKVRRGGEWLPANAWASNAGTGELDVTMGRRVTDSSDRPTQTELIRVGPDDWVAEGDPIPGLPVERN